MSDKPNKIYIAGPMRGKPNWNYDAFNRAEYWLKFNGWEVVNPATLDTNYQETENLDATPESFDPKSNDDHKIANRRIMRRDVDVICDECVAIYMLKDWEISRGACCEFYLSTAIGLEIYYEGGINDIGNERISC